MSVCIVIFLELFGANACVAEKLHGMFYVAVGCRCMCDVIKPATVVLVVGVPLYVGERFVLKFVVPLDQQYVDERGGHV